MLSIQWKRVMERTVNYMTSLANLILGPDQFILS